MAKEHDSWLAGIGVEMGGKNTSVTAARKDGGGSLSVEWAHKKSLATTTAIGPVPVFIKGTVKVAVVGQVEAVNKGGKYTVSGSVNGVVSGTIMLGPGVADKTFTVGLFGSIGLSASQGVQVTYDQNLEEGKRWAVVTPLTIFVKGKGELGATIEVENQPPSFTVTAVSKDWELYVITLSGWDGQRFTQVDIRDGKDMVLLKQFLAKPGPAIQAAVEKYAPQALKDAADKGAKWTAESDEAKAIGDGTGKVLDTVKDVTGSDVGAKVENAAAYLISDDQETGSQTTARQHRASVALNASSEEYVRVMTELGLFEGGALTPHCSPDERNKVQDAMNADREAKPPTGAWVDAANALAEKARARQKQKAQAAAQARKDETEGKAKQAIEDARKLAEAAKQAVAQMEAVRLAASGPGNHLNNTTLKVPNPKARMFWEQGMQKFWTPAELQRNQLPGLQGKAKISKAQELSGLYIKAQSVFQAGVQHL